MTGRTVLVSAMDGESASAVVLGDEDDAWLVGSLKRLAGQRLRGTRPAQIGLPRGQRVIGGRLPATASSVEVVAADGEHVRCAVANGAWIVVLTDTTFDESNVPVRYYDEGGALVAPLLPTDWPRAPVVDADVKCLGCGMVAWDEVTALHGSRDKSGGHASPAQPATAVVCRACGYEERLGGRVAQASDRSGISKPAGAGTSARLGVIEARFPVYAVDGMPGRVVGTSHSNGAIIAVTVAHGTGAGGEHGDLTVRTDQMSNRLLEIDPATLVRRQLARSLARPIRQQDCSDAAFALALADDRRRSHRVALNSSVTHRRISVGSESADLAYAQLDSVWAAVARTDAVQLTLSGNGQADGAVRLSTFETADSPKEED